MPKKLFHQLPEGLFSFVFEKLDKPQNERISSLYNLFGIVWVNYGANKKYQHRELSHCFSISSHYLRRYLGDNYLSLFETTQLISIEQCHSYEAHATRAYMLTSLANEIISEFMEQYAREEKYADLLPCVSLKKVGRKSAAIASRDANNNHSTCRWQIEKNIQVDLTSLSGLLESTRLNDRAKKTVEQLICIGSAGNNKETSFMLPQDYTEAVSGRLYGNGLHLQFMPKEVRRAALNNQTEYDFSNCHYSIMSQLAKRYGLRTPYIDYYLENKRPVRLGISKELALPLSIVKQSMIALIYGATIRSDAKQAIYDIVGHTNYLELVSHKLFKGLAHEVRQCKTEIITNHSINKGVRNVVRKTLNKRTNGGATPTINEKLAHILQGYEVAMLHIAIRLFGDSITLIQHDGFTSTNDHLNTDLLQRTIEQELGFKMAIEKEKFRMYIIQNSQPATEHAA